MTRVVFAGREKLRVPAAWDTFTWHGRRYRLAGAVVEVWDTGRHAWLPSIRLTVSSPKGRAA